MKKQTVYVPVRNSDKSFAVHTKLGWIYIEEQKEAYVFSEEEVKEIITEAWGRGYDFCDGKEDKSLEQFLQSKLNHEMKSIAQQLLNKH